MTRPIRIYLDSSDYAVLAQAAIPTDAWHLRQYLLRSVASGDVEIGMSYFNVFELLQDYEPEFRHNRLERAQVLRELCGTNAFPYITDLKEGDGFSKDGAWIGRATLALLNPDLMRKRMCKIIKSSPNLNRSDRRRFGNPKRLVKFLRDNPNWLSFAEADGLKLPYPRECLDPNYYRKIITDDVDREEASAVLRGLVTDPVSLLQIWFEHYQKDNPLTEQAHELASSLRQSIAKLRSAFRDWERANRTVNAQRRKLLKMGVKLESKVNYDELGIACDFDPENPGPNFFYDQILLLRDELPEEQGRLLSCALMGLVLHESSFKNSDLVDLLHLAYLPLCDLWRGDKAFCSVLEKVNAPGYNRVVSRLGQLRGRIEDLQRMAA